MIDRRHLALAALALPLWSGAARAQSAANPLADRIRAGGCAVLWRHAQTEPGTGDPPGFKLDNCSTQRNLSAAGRKQASAAGEWFRKHALKPRAVRSSPWCRCTETADLAFGRHEVWMPLASIFDGQGDEDMARRQMLSRASRIPAGGFEVWVTHQVNITALTREVPSMGEALLVDSG
ncbi:MAG: histidine phosphatase family protein, partial [Gammaproteobacteria bacterium]|nr:histidine phosphatase family protein [Gammaproteobacteria bacterium]MBU1443245.1 histidine phosphatase family protein [Gammaproteobacteria bacterium]